VVSLSFQVVFLGSEYSTTEHSAHVRIEKIVPSATEPYVTDIDSATTPSGRGTVRILDTTLRDGEQTPGISLTPEQKMSIATMLDDLGVDTIEAGFPITSAGERKAARMIASSGLDAKVICLARAETGDIEKVIDCGVSGVHIFISSSDIHLRDQLKVSREEMMEKAGKSVEFAKAHGLEIEFSAMDATRTETSHLIEVAGVVKDAGATMFDIADTVGICTPERMRGLVHAIGSTGIDVSVHCHNDFGLAVANSIAAVDAGAKQVHVTLIGIGERAGNTSLEEFVMAAQRLYGYSTGIRIEMLARACSFVSGIAGFPIPVNKPIV
jgi:isopropylmalate/homocitrate/citramalate synthase